MAVTGLWALVYAYRQLKQGHEEAQVERLLNQVRLYGEQPMVSYRIAYAEQRLKGVSRPSAQYEILNFFETIGLLVDRGYLDATDVWENFSDDMLTFYADTRDELLEEQRTDPTFYNHFVSLIEKLRVIEKAQHGTREPVTKEDLKDYWTDETTLVPGSPPVRKRPQKSK
jgi:hypothetical protein